MKSLEEIKEIKRNVEIDLLSIPGVNGVGIGYKQVGGQSTDELSIHVYVDKKRRNVSNIERIPSHIQGIPTDVIERETTAVPYSMDYLQKHTTAFEVIKKILSNNKLGEELVNATRKEDMAALHELMLKNNILASDKEIFEALEIYTKMKSAFKQKDEKSADDIATPVKYDPTRVFIVHGHDDGSKFALQEILRELGLEPIILHTKANAGKTIVEKFEEHAANVGYAFVLLTPDDEGRERFEDTTVIKSRNKEEELKSRARQNVILELGYFMGKLGRDRVCCIYKGEMDIPSDISGVAHLSYERKIDDCYRDIIRELREAHYEI